MNTNQLEALMALSPACTYRGCDIKTSEGVRIYALLMVASVDRLAAPLPFQGFMEIGVTSEGSQSGQQGTARHAAPQNILEGEKYQVRTIHVPKQHAKRAALFISAPLALVIQGPTKCSCSFVL